MTDSGRSRPRPRRVASKKSSGTSPSTIDTTLVAPQTAKVAAVSGSTQAVAVVAVAAVGLLLWRSWRRNRPNQKGNTGNSQATNSNKAAQQTKGGDGFRFDKLFTPGAPPPKPKPPAQDVQVATSNIPRNKAGKKNRKGSKGSGSAKRHDAHDANDGLPEYESTKFDKSKDAWVNTKTKFENKGGRVVMHKETTTYSKG